ncbi:unnamed protein product [Moneuplotes crassus]|uniref:Uncharacterized protein n=1 Tax=Euplotes crassus TaxID=5936 RepID=A0AAD2DB12_EUPCR|nr:unnamed protein product [Moneuplotes crassus]
MTFSYFVNYFQNTFHLNTRKYLAQASRYRLIFCCLALIMVDHSLDFQVEKELKKIVALKRAFDKIDTDDDIQSMVKAINETDDKQLV